MRLDKDKIIFLKQLITNVRPKAQIYLFGSRVDHRKRGGDIDILILDNQPLSVSEKSKILMNFWNKFGEQKVDLVCFTREERSAFKRLALDQAIQL